MVLTIRKLQKLSQVRKLFDKNSENRSISIDKYATASYNITIIKQNNLIKSEGRRNYQLGKKGKKGKKKDFPTKEKELLEIENLKLQKREKQASIISTIVIMIVSVITAILKWLGLID